MVKHNNILPNGHFRKHWQRRVKTWLDQAGKKESRRRARLAKAVRIAPRPVDGLLRPAVRCQTVRYNMKLRAGRGFTLEELKAAGIRKKEARSIGVAVDHRRRNESQESLDLNVQRLLAYKNKLVVFPRKAKVAKKGDSSAQEVASAVQLTGSLMPITNVVVAEAPRKITAAEKESKAYVTLRQARSAQRNKGKFAKRVAEKAAAKEASGK